MTFSLNAERQALRATLLPAAALLDLRDWFPVTLTQQHEIVWRHLPERFTTPFFNDALHPGQHERACVTPWPPAPPLAHALQQLPHVAPSAFVFHVSRCGSTLLTQLLTTLPQCIVMSEPPIIDACLRSTRHLTPAQQIDLLQYMMRALGQQRQTLENRFIIKLDSWHIQYLPLLRTAFPHTACWFLYREPQAVLASHQRQRGPQMVPGLILPQQLPQQPGPELAPGDLDGYCIGVLAWMMRQALTHAAHLQWLNYSELPDAIWHRLLPQMGVQCDAAHIAAMRARAGFHAKNRDSAFHGDPGLTPPLTATQQRLQQALQQTLLPLYQQLEQLRLKTLKID
jgi:hypothetical protein